MTTRSTIVISMTLREILSASCMATSSLDLDLTIGTVDYNIDFDRTHLLSSLSPLSPPLASPPSAAAAEEPT